MQDSARSFRVAILGGGLAGMATAAALADRNTNQQPFQISLFESKRRTGGRAGSFSDPSSQLEIDYCQHVGMGCCTNLLHLLQLAKIDPFFSRTSKLTFIEPASQHSAGSVSHFKPNEFLPAPLHLAAAFAGLKYLSRRERRLIRTALWALIRMPSDSLITNNSHTGADTSIAPRSLTMGQWLRQHGQTDRLIDRFWNLILASALGDHVDAVAIAPARKVFVDGFLRASDSSNLLIPQRPLSELFGDRLPAYLVQQGVQLFTGCRVRQVDLAAPNQFSVTTDRVANESFDAVVAAVPWFGLEKLVRGSSLAAAVPNLAEINSLPCSPISGIHLWLDRELTSLPHAALPHAVLVGTLSQWVFRSTPPQPSTATGQAEYYYQVVISGSHDLRGRSSASIEAEILRDLRAAFPEAGKVRCLRSKIVSDPQAVFSIRPDVQTIRPTTETLQPGFVLAGDYVQTGWPATMEGAILSGFQAAEAVGKALGAPLQSVQPPQRVARLTSWLVRQ